MILWDAEDLPSLQDTEFTTKFSSKVYFCEILVFHFCDFLGRKITDIFEGHLEIYFSIRGPKILSEPKVCKGT